MPWLSPICSWVPSARSIKIAGRRGSRLSRLTGLSSRQRDLRGSPVGRHYAPQAVVIGRLSLLGWLRLTSMSRGSAPSPLDHRATPLLTLMPSPTICSLVLALCPCEQRASGPRGPHDGADPPTLRIPP